jgi:hypothetical protein
MVALSLALVVTAAWVTSVDAYTILGTGTGALVGSDLTDVGNDGVEGSYAPPALAGFDAEFFASKEAAFGGGEFSFNVFDNLVGGGNDKSCCEASPIIIGARFGGTLATGSQLISLSRFTLTSSNDSPGRDPDVWSIEGSINTTTGLDGTWTPIYSSITSDWTARNQVIAYGAVDGDTFLTTAGFKAFRLNVTSVDDGDTSAFALGEMELFGTVFTPPVPEPSTFGMAIFALGCFGFVHWRRRRRYGSFRESIQ